jgi:hypothetical protein
MCSRVVNKRLLTVVSAGDLGELTFRDSVK